MGVLKVGEVRKLMHKAGINRVSRKLISAIDEAVGKAIAEMGTDLAKVFPNQMVETSDLVRVSDVKGGYTVMVEGRVEEEINIEDLVSGEPLPEEIGDGEEEEVEGKGGEE